MAQRVNVVLVDDIDGSNADETITFGLDGSEYEIDLKKKHASELRKALEPFVGAARRTGGRRGKSRKSAGGGPNPAEIRQWARDNGYDVPVRGRIPESIRDAYSKAPH